eukprot:15462754-Alexandrium_andersonii.AAC.1
MAILGFWTASALAGASAGNSMWTGNDTMEECAAAASVNAGLSPLCISYELALAAGSWGCSTQAWPTGVSSSGQSSEERAFGLLARVASG